MEIGTIESIKSKYKVGGKYYYLDKIYDHIKEILRPLIIEIIIDKIEYNEGFVLYYCTFFLNQYSSFICYENSQNIFSTYEEAETALEEYILKEL